MKKIIRSVLTLFGVYTFFENFLSLRVRHEGNGNKLKILHISDIHKKNSPLYLGRIAAVAEKESPDVIFITGDLISRTERYFTVVDDFAQTLCEVAPVYMCIGNHEQSLPKSKRTELMKTLRSSGVVILRNKYTEVTLNNEKYHICGVMPKYTVYKKNGRYRDLDDFTVSDMTELLGERPDGMVLLLAHTPIFAQAYAKWGADYTFSGHIHGGIVRIGGVGLLSPERKFFPKYTKGIYKVGKMKLCVTSGIGKLRLFNPPEIVVYNI